VSELSFRCAAELSVSVGVEGGVVVVDVDQA
jgi:hypothetical protein